jgi:8-oxo-dGTP pyrophosphatase MutT (NUDIX family)
VSENTKKISELPRWITLQNEVLAKTRIFNLEKSHRIEEGSNKRGDFYVLNANDWINVIALTPNNEAVLVEQFRHGTEEFELEIVGGIVDRNEEPQEADLRELHEETGYIPTQSSKVIQIGKVLPNPAFLNNACYTFLVTNAKQEAEQKFDDHENIIVRLEPLEKIDDLIRAGTITHSLVVAAFMWLKLSGLTF